VEDRDDLAKQEAFFRDVMDPYVLVLVDAEDPWAAYEAVASMRGVMHDYLAWGPNGGAAFVAWSELEDVYETGKTPVDEAHAALRQAGVEWLERPAKPSDQYVEAWIARASQAVGVFSARDGD
jgi:hypothetical protein